SVKEVSDIGVELLLCRLFHARITTNKTTRLVAALRGKQNDNDRAMLCGDERGVVHVAVGAVLVVGFNFGGNFDGDGVGDAQTRDGARGLSLILLGLTRLGGLGGLGGRLVVEADRKRRQQRQGLERWGAVGHDGRQVNATRFGVVKTQEAVCLQRRQLPQTLLELLGADGAGGARQLAIDGLLDVLVDGSGVPEARVAVVVVFLGVREAGEEIFVLEALRRGAAAGELELADWGDNNFFRRAGLGRSLEGEVVGADAHFGVALAVDAGSDPPHAEPAGDRLHETHGDGEGEV
ncbi:hypothetical protein BKA80DRAFT_334688, partial [Phyllosticta citrichinensis]